MDILDETVARVLDSERIRHGRLDHQVIADRSGINLRSVYRYLNGERSIPMSKFIALCNAIGVEAGQVVQTALDIFNTAEQEQRVQSSDK